MSHIYVIFVSTKLKICHTLVEINNDRRSSSKKMREDLIRAIFVKNKNECDVSKLAGANYEKTSYVYFFSS